MEKRIWIQFQLSQHFAVYKPVARMWLDKNVDYAVQDEEEIPLEADKLAFTADTAVDVSTFDGMPFFVRYIGSTGAKWTITITSPSEGQEGSEGPVMYATSGIVGHPKGWILGILTQGGDQQ